MRKVKEHGVVLPDKYIGFPMVNALQLNEGDIKALLNYPRGSILRVDIREWVRKHETKLQVSHGGHRPQGWFYIIEEHYGIGELHPEYDTEYEDEINMVEEALRDLQGGDDEEGDPTGDGGSSEVGSTLEEHEAAEVLSTILQQRKKTYQQTLKAKKSKELLWKGPRQGDLGHGHWHSSLQRRSVQNDG